MTKERKLMDKSQARVLLLYMLKYLNKICETAEIPCYASGGTCLGAVRHQGFIPWDDDIDYMMPRKYYDLFVETAERILPDVLVLRTRENDPYFCCEYIKLCFKDAEKVYSELSIDVFFLDETNPERKWFRAYQNFWLIQLYYIKLYKVSKDRKGDFYKPQNTVKHIWLSIMSHMSYRQIDTWHKKLMTCEKKQTPYWINWGSCYSYKKATYLKSALGTPQKHQFENTYIYIAEKPEEILEHLYGSNYMMPPPENKRTDHGVEEMNSPWIDMDMIRREVNL